MTKALVTGGAGFIGSHTVDLLLQRGYSVRVLDALAPPVHQDSRVPDYLSAAVEFMHGDVRDRKAMLRALHGVDVVFHLAAYQDYLTDFSRFFDVNATGTALLLDSTGAEVASTPISNGIWEFSGIANGTYYVLIRNTSGLVDQLFANVPCPAGACNVAALGTPIVLSGTVANRSVNSGQANINLRLPTGQTIAGTVRDAANNAPLNGVTVYFFNATGTVVGQAQTDGLGQYVSAGSLPSGSYYAATANGPAQRNGLPIAASTRTELVGADVLTTRAALAPEHWPKGVPDLKRSFRASLAYRLCLAAEGRHDAMLTLRDAWEWDIAAGSLIAERAGCRVTDRTGAALRFNEAIPLAKGTIAANPVLHGEILAALGA